LLAACSGDGDQAHGPMTRPIELGFSQLSNLSPWSQANTQSIQSAAHDAGITLHYMDAQRKQENQIIALRTFIAQRVDVIVLSPYVETGWETVLREARDAKIPVILTDRGVEVSDDSLYVSMIGSDFVEQGRRAGRWLLDYTRDLPGEMDIVELQGTAGSSPANDRKQGFAEVIAADPRYRIIRSQSGDFSRAEGKLVMERFLEADGRRIRVLFAHNDEMALGAIEAMEEAGFKPGTDILVISIDGTRQAFEAMIAGKLNVTVECNPLFGPQLMEAVKRVAAGQPVPKRIVTEEAVFTRASATRDLPTRRY
jgi:galactofuranose transport system substrate-binding protein